MNAPLRRGCKWVCFSGVMINRIITPRLAAVAFAASVVIAAPAVADPVNGALLKLEKELSHDTSLVIQIGGNDYRRGNSHRGYRDYRDRRYGPRLNEFGQTPRQERRLRRDAIQMCRRATAHQAYNIGFHEVDFDNDRRVRQLGPRGFRVRLKDVEFEGRRRDIERDVVCTVRRGRVVNVEGVPQPRRRGYRSVNDRRDPGRDRRGYSNRY